MTLLTGQEIRDSDIVVSDCIDIETQIQPGGLDLTVYKVDGFPSAESCGMIDFDNSKRYIPKTYERKFGTGLAEIPDRVYLEKGVYKLHLHPILEIPMDCMAFAMPRSTITRCGCGIHGGFWDPGYIGDSQVLFEVYNPNGVFLYKNARIIQLVFARMGKDAEKPYRGKYQGQGTKKKGLELPIKAGMHPAIEDVPHHNLPGINLSTADRLIKEGITELALPQEILR